MCVFPSKSKFVFSVLVFYIQSNGNSLLSVRFLIHSKLWYRFFITKFVPFILNSILSFQILICSFWSETGIFSSGSDLFFLWYECEKNKCEYLSCLISDWKRSISMKRWIALCCKWFRSSLIFFSDKFSFLRSNKEMNLHYLISLDASYGNAADRSCIKRTRILVDGILTRLSWKSTFKLLYSMHFLPFL